MSHIIFILHFMLTRWKIPIPCEKKIVAVNRRFNCSSPVLHPNFLRPESYSSAAKPNVIVPTYMYRFLLPRLSFTASSAVLDSKNLGETKIIPLWTHEKSSVSCNIISVTWSNFSPAKYIPLIGNRNV